MKLKINKKFETLCPALSSDEFQRLEQNCLEDGRVLDAILIWKDQIIDGHNRYKIATKHGLKFDTVCRTFKDDKEAENWIINHQLGRRNLNPQAQSYLRGKLHQARKLNKSENSKKTKPQNEVSFSTADEIAAETGVSKSTVQRDDKYAEAVDSLAKPIQDAVKSGELRATKTEIQQLAEYDKQSQKQIVDSVQSGEVGSIKEAIEGDDEQAASSNGKAKPSAASLVDQLLRKHVGYLVRGIDAVAEANGGKGKYHRHANEGLNLVIGSLRKMREGQQ